MLGRLLSVFLWFKHGFFLHVKFFDSKHVGVFAEILGQSTVKGVPSIKVGEQTCEFLSRVLC